MKLRKTQVAAAVGAVLLAGAAQAQVQPAQQGINVQLYGQVHRAVMFADDGHQSKWFHVDGQPSSTRFGINATGQAIPGLRVGGRFEAEMKSNPSDTVNFATPSAGGPALGERWLDIHLEGAWGRINMGQGSGAADDASTLDLSGTSLANGNCTSDFGGGIVWRTSAGGNVAGAGAIGGTTPATNKVLDTHVCNDFESRYDRVMYTTPTFGGFRFQVGQGQKSALGESTEASVWYSGKLAGELVAAIGYSSVNTSTPAGVEDRKTVGGSISWLHTSGFNISLWMTKVDGISGVASTVDDRTGEFTGGKIGYKWGPHAIAVDYGVFNDMAARGDEGKTYGIGYTWNPARWLEIYATYKIFMLDRPGVEIEDVNVGAIGTRVRF